MDLSRGYPFLLTTIFLFWGLPVCDGQVRMTAAKIQCGGVISPPWRRTINLMNLQLCLRKRSKNKLITIVNQFFTPWNKRKSEPKKKIPRRPSTDQCTKQYIRRSWQFSRLRIFPNGLGRCRPIDLGQINKGDYMIIFGHAFGCLLAVKGVHEPGMEYSMYVCM